MQELVVSSCRIHAISFPKTQRHHLLVGNQALSWVLFCFIVTQQMADKARDQSSRASSLLLSLGGDAGGKQKLRLPISMLKRSWHTLPGCPLQQSQQIVELTQSKIRCRTHPSNSEGAAALRPECPFYSAVFNLLCSVPNLHMTTTTPASFLPGQTLSPTAASCVPAPCCSLPSLLPGRSGRKNLFFSCSLDVVGHILIPGVVAALLLLAVAVGILVILARKRKKAPSGAAVEMDRTRSASHTGADALNYAVINHCTGIAESQLYSNVEAFRCLVNTATEYMEVKQSNKYLEEEKEATYASVHKSPMEQQEIYANVPLAPQP
ncbi:uncharacterized protein LOC121082418 isoform X1 [Falco naumanni]|uniref:uncharacterized protein LOC121082418 isoform X1 n=1 Tax=Falco naumanni TaxID=148594 RepID=UPI001ADE6D7E|nr:uncharacterized protein LOC121082418 isoform X1 [Falco naumanni]